MPALKHIGCLALMAGLAVPAAAEKAPSLEVAVRWDPAQGGPGTAAAAWKALGLAPGEGDKFEVRYFDIVKGPALPAGFTAIGRERRRLGDLRYELTYKMRGESPLPASSPLSDWVCPVGETDNRKDEQDISFLAQQAHHTAQSRSCTVESSVAPPAVPSSLEIRQSHCHNTTVRLKRSDDKIDTKVEEWHLPTGKRLIEVSQSGKQGLVDADGFESRVVRKLSTLKRPIHPLPASKTELGSTCKP